VPAVFVPKAKMEEHFRRVDSTQCQFLGQVFSDKLNNKLCIIVIMSHGLGLLSRIMNWRCQASGWLFAAIHLESQPTLIY
jgi:uncharacterized membrane protein YqhA